MRQSGNSYYSKSTHQRDIDSLCSIQPGVLIFILLRLISLRTPFHSDCHCHLPQSNAEDALKSLNLATPLQSQRTVIFCDVLRGLSRMFVFISFAQNIQSYPSQLSIDPSPILLHRDICQPRIVLLCCCRQRCSISSWLDCQLSVQIQDVLVQCGMVSTSSSLQSFVCGRTPFMMRRTLMPYVDTKKL